MNAIRENFRRVDLELKGLVVWRDHPFFGSKWNISTIVIEADESFKLIAQCQIADQRVLKSWMDILPRASKRDL